MLSKAFKMKCALRRGDVENFPITETVPILIFEPLGEIGSLCVHFFALSAKARPTVNRLFEEAAIILSALTLPVRIPYSIGNVGSHSIRY